MKKWTFGKHTLLSVIIAVVIKLVMQRPTYEAASYGIIGCADGPTSIFISRKGSILRSYLRKYLWIAVFPVLLLLYLPIRCLAQDADGE